MRVKKSNHIITMLGVLFILAAVFSVSAHAGAAKTWSLHIGDTSSGPTSYLTGNTTVTTQDTVEFSGCSVFYMVGGAGGISTFEIDTSQNAYAFGLTSVTESQVQQAAGGDWSGTTVTIGVYTANEDTEAAWASAEAHVIYYGKPVDSGSTPWMYPLRAPPAKYLRAGLIMSGVTPLDGVAATLIRLPGSANWINPRTDTVGAMVEFETVSSGSGVSSYRTLYGDPPAGCKSALVCAEGAIRYTLDDITNPTTSTGNYMDETRGMIIDRELLPKLRTKAESGAVGVQIHYLNR
jgi:hypothetical protein